MRGRSILREPPGLSICAFCAHRLSASRLPSHVQHRFLQSSRPASRPPAAAAAAQEEDGGSSAQNFQSSSTSASGWGTPWNSAPSSVGGFGRRPNFGNASTSEPGTNSSGRRVPAFGMGTIELTEEEKMARDLVNQSAEQQQRRRVNIYPNPGPKSSRAGRATPIPEATIQAIVERSLRKQKAMDVEQQRKERLRNGPRISRLLMRDSPSRKQESSSPEANFAGRSWDDKQIDDQAPSWGQLRRRGDDPINQPVPKPEDIFSQGRAQREEEAKTARYTPLGSKSMFGAGRDAARDSMLKPSAFPRSPVVRNVNSKSRTTGPLRDGSSGPKRPSRLEKGAVADSGSGYIVRRLLPSKYGQPGDYQQVKTPDSYDAASAEAVTPSVTAVRVHDEEMKRRLELEREREERQRRRAEKFAAGEANQSQRLEDTSRGRGRDNAKRRQQFVHEYEEEQESAAAKAELKRRRKREKAAKKAAAPTPILLPEYISVANLAAALKVRVEDFIYKMEELGFEETGYDYVLNGENAALIAMEYNFEPIVDRGESEDLKARPPAEDPSILPQRPPVVTIMGHVDHGKTTLLDWLRKSSVAATEHGGITQHIGAFSVPMPSGKLITFLDTPGHAAFLSMRQRGANVTDIVILVVAADDSVKPQTIEAIKHAKAAKVPMIVAINKVDKEDANIDRVKQDLARQGVEIEDFGGDTQVVCVSGRTGQGMAELEEAAVTLSEILDMRAEIDGQAEGWVLEASIKPMGKVATVLVRRGTMRPGDFIVAGKAWARIRCLRNEAGVEVAEAGPGMPVEIGGWKEQPLAGDEVLQAPTESKAKSVVDYRLEQEERNKMAEDMKAINEARKMEQEKRERENQEESLAAASPEPTSPMTEAANAEQVGGPKQIYFIVKGDVSGSVEAVIDSMSSIGNAEVQPHVLRSGVGQITEFDIEHAAAAKGYLINFNTTIDPNILRLAEAAKVKIIDHNIIYRLVDDIKVTLAEYLPPLVTHRVLGEAEVAQVFQITSKGRQHKAIAGCKVKNGMVAKNAKVRVLRNGGKIYDGTMASLKNVKKDVTEMRKGSECGIGFESWQDFQIGDQVQTYETKEEKRYL